MQLFEYRNVCGYNTLAQEVRNNWDNENFYRDHSKHVRRAWTLISHMAANHGYLEMKDGAQNAGTLSIMYFTLFLFSCGT